MTDQELLHRFSSANPITDYEDDEALTADQWQEMFEGIVAHERPRRRITSHGHGKGVRWAAVVAFAAGIAIVVPTLWTDGPTGASPAAADALHRAADAARARQSLPAPGPGQYLYRSSEERGTSMHVPGHGLENFLFTETVQREAWSKPDGSGRNLTEASSITFPTAADEIAWRAAGQPRLHAAARDEHLGVGDHYVLDVNDVPTDPEELLAALERREILGGDPADWVTFQIIGELLPLVYHSPEHRAALYEVAANFPGVEYEGETVDPLGRSGATVSYEGGGLRYEFVFDPETAELLGNRIILLEQEENLIDEDTWPGTTVAFAGPSGTVVWWEIYKETAVVDSTDERP